MHLQRCRETHGSVNQAGTLPAPLPVGRSPRRLGSKCYSQWPPRFPSESGRVSGAGVWAAGPGGSLNRYRAVDTGQSEKQGLEVMPQTITLILHRRCLIFKHLLIHLYLLHTFTIIQPSRKQDHPHPHASTSHGSITCETRHTP